MKATADNEPSVTCTSRWTGATLVWTINGEDVNDYDLRRWCSQNLDPVNWVHDVIRLKHIKAWAGRKK